jgi:hypothetical protein
MEFLYWLNRKNCWNVKLATLLCQVPMFFTVSGLDKIYLDNLSPRGQ